MLFQVISKTMSDTEIKVLVVSYPDRKYLMMRFVDPVTGKQKARSTKTTDPSKAAKLAAKWEAELIEGRYQPAAKITWDAFRERYEAEVVPALAEKTGIMIATVFNAVEKLASPRKLGDLTAERLSFFQAELRKGGRAEPTIRTYLAHLRSALRWAAEVGLLRAVPKIQKPKRAKTAKLMKGRPITAEEFERMLKKTKAVVSVDHAKAWRRFLRGLWLSGLRLGEAMQLYWDRDDRLRIHLSGKRPMLRIPAEFEKGNEDRLLPISPEFAEFLLAVPAERRRSRVFRLSSLRIHDARPSVEWVSRIISRIGNAAKVKVNTDPKSGKVKFASAHDLRRSFGERWARRVMPQVLKELMRHKSIETTMKFYVGQNAEKTADALWLAYSQLRETDLGNTLGNSRPKSASAKKRQKP
jgi:integrase